ncbi:D-alanyl-D-alanine carboxypeptidase family protein [Hoyosella altamirensis]|uniref:D-alanyl-D-alanine carboxypeptidase (Penicillin-binding protein 5/6) n=1 Tax=Hoyosella altamirensis TaxID=616997 RepID=A0A839RTN5_9ACTN|nr:serine hydrolase [Hoyosella altamirensis]MBB3039719.1 D-alanyl-D-alanine carboxypeptidase (penicillin-binding protein 5/6) [Hoyosella altamirensis]
MSMPGKVRFAAFGAVATVAAAGLGMTPAAAQQIEPPQPSPTTSPAPLTTPDTSDCPVRVTPPPPVDSSEEPQPGRSAPTPLPIPDTPVGGPRLADCELVLAPGVPEPPEEISAASWLVADLDTGDVLAAKDPHGRHRPASTIKTLLALVAFDEIDLGRTIIGTIEDANIEGSRAGIGPGGEYTNELLMKALVMASGNDAANAIAQQLGGVDETLRKMNEYAAELGALDTRAATPSGLDGPGMSSSAYDLAVIFRAAMENPVFVDYLQTPHIDFPGYPADPATPGDFDRPGFAMGNDNVVNWMYPDSIGGKNGFTNSARQTYVGAAERDGRRLIVSVMMAENEPKPVWQQVADLFDYGFGIAGDSTVGTLDARTSIDEAEPVDESLAQALPPSAVPVSDPSAESPSMGQRVVVGSLGALVVAALLYGAFRVGRRTD